MSARAGGGACLAMLLTVLASCSVAFPRDPRPLAPGASMPQTVLELANRLRASGCDGRSRVAPPLRREAHLDAAAQRLADGASLDAATASVGYRAMRSVSLEITGSATPSALRNLLASRCGEWMAPALSEIGIYQRSDGLWMLIAQPFDVPELSDPQRVATEVNDLVNRARAAPRRCGLRLFGPAPPLHPSVALRAAALAHSRDMAARSVLEHRGRHGSTPGERVKRTGYLWRAVGENIAAGAPTAREVVAGWLASPEHCANIMDPDFIDTAVAYAIDPHSRMGVYWTEDFAAPQQRPRRHGTSPGPRH